MTGVTAGQAAEIPDAFARYQLATFPSELGDFAEHETAMRWKHLTGERERDFWRSLDAAQQPQAAPELGAATIEEHRWYAVVRGPGGDVIKVIGYRGDSGISYHDSIEDWHEASEQ